ncbi:MAG: hypothetical protein CL913_00440 [Deltaproteobacteria bacterium]|nr:hypothetical protein [Deltaproteobacteria bacterium]
MLLHLSGNWSPHLYSFSTGGYRHKETYDVIPFWLGLAIVFQTVVAWLVKLIARICEKPKTNDCNSHCQVGLSFLVCGVT